MTDEANWLLSTRLRGVAARLASGEDAAALWREAQGAVDAAGAGEEVDVALPVLERSLPDLQALVAAWDAGRARPPLWDQAVLKRAMNAFKRRLDLMRTDEESSSGRNPLSKGGRSSITGVRPPERFTKDVWDLLVAQGRLRDAGGGVLEPASA
jgi:hypothetical protein